MRVYHVMIRQSNSAYVSCTVASATHQLRLPTTRLCRRKIGNSRVHHGQREQHPTRVCHGKSGNSRNSDMLDFPIWTCSISRFGHARFPDSDMLDFPIRTCSISRFGRARYHRIKSVYYFIVLLYNARESGVVAEVQTEKQKQQEKQSEVHIKSPP
jgi:hypothetical protein